MSFNKISQWALRIIPALILLQTLYFKFSAAPESVYIFETMGLEPYGRIGLGIVELITGILLLIPRTTWMGAVLGTGIMAGAIFSHLTVLGINVQGDGGALFAMAVITFVCCAIQVWMYRKEVPFLNSIVPG